jgi:hypothetical protein
VLGAAMLLAGCNTVPASAPSNDSADTGTTAAPASTKATKETPAKASREREPKEGEVVGKPAPNSKFNQVKIGMGMKQVTDLIGQPTDQGAYVTGKAFIPFYFGPDQYRHELLYKGQGRLVFSGGGVGNLSSGRLSRIIHNAEESGYR